MKVCSLTRTLLLPFSSLPDLQTHLKSAFIQREILIALIGNRCRYKNLLLLYGTDLKTMDLPTQQHKNKSTKKNTQPKQSTTPQKKLHFNIFDQQESSASVRREDCRKSLSKRHKAILLLEKMLRHNIWQSDRRKTERNTQFKSSGLLVTKAAAEQDSHTL